MSPSCPLLLLSVFKLENHLSQKLEILFRAWVQKNKRITIDFLFFSFLVGGGGGGWDPTSPEKKYQIWILCQNSLTRELKIRVVGVVLKVIHVF